MFGIFKGYKNLVISISKRKDGSMRISDYLSEKNRDIFLRKLKINPKSLVSAGLVHGSNIRVVGEKHAGKVIKNVDGLLTSSKNLFLSITTADCLPIFIYDKKKEVIGLVHGGWRGLQKCILKKAVKKMTQVFGSFPSNILAFIGPGISKRHYNVDSDVADKFRKISRGVLSEKGNKTFLDLKSVAKTQLLRLGLMKENIEISPECTFCLPQNYFSYRRERDKPPKTMISVFGMK